MDSYEKMKNTKKWHHDIKKIEGEWVEHIVEKFQKTGDEQILMKITENYAIFRPKWAKAFAQYFDGDIEEGARTHDRILWLAAEKFDLSKGRKAEGRAFNAYLVSSMLNCLKNYKNQKQSHKNWPRRPCPLCGEKVFMIDENHLKHKYTLERYKKAFPQHSLLSLDGSIKCPITGKMVLGITDEYIAGLNREAKMYTLEDFRAEYPHLSNRKARCPISGIVLTENEITAKYPASLASGYTEERFSIDFPSFEGFLPCPFSDRKMLEMSQSHLDEVLGQNIEKSGRLTTAKIIEKYPNLTLIPRQVDVVNPYTGQTVKEITPSMLSAAGTTVMEHVQKYATIVLGKRYFDLITCPFTGRKTKCIEAEDLEEMGVSTFQFYSAVCQYPLRKFLVKCAICGEEVENIWIHLATTKKPHCYAEEMTMENFEKNFGIAATKVFVTTNSYVQGDSGDSVHISDLVIGKCDKQHKIEVQDSLTKVAKDPLDHRLVDAIGEACNIEDIFYIAAEKRIVKIAQNVKGSKDLRAAARQMTSLKDFDLADPRLDKAGEVTILIPSRETMKQKLTSMLSQSDIEHNLMSSVK